MVTSEQLTSDKQDELMKLQREKRCGMIIWSTVLMGIYISVYIVLNNDRFEPNVMQFHN